MDVKEHTSRKAEIAFWHAWGDALRAQLPPRTESIEDYWLRQIDTAHVVTLYAGADIEPLRRSLPRGSIR